MVDELEIEKWLNHNCKVEYVEGHTLLVGRNYYQLGTWAVTGLESIKKFFSSAGKFYVYRDQESRILQNVDGRVLMSCCRVEGNKRYS